MKLRTRLTLLTACAVALAVIASAGVAWLLVRGSMLEDIDEELEATSQQVEEIALDPARSPTTMSQPMLQLIELIQDDPVGLHLQLPHGPTSQVTFEPLTSALKNVSLPPAPTPGTARFQTFELDGVAYRMHVRTSIDGTVIRLFQPLTAVDSTLKSMAWTLMLIATAGVAIAAALGWFVSRAALRPVDRLVSATENVAVTQDLTERIEVPQHRSDEIARLASSVNAMLAALDRAKADQRELIENAGHELRTPLAVLRNDFGLLAKMESSGSRTLSVEDRRELIDDLEAQVSALTDEVNEIIALARGDRLQESAVETELLALVTRAAQRTRRLNPAVEIVVHGEPAESTVQPASLERAVSNLVRNAVQASPDHAEVTVTLRTTLIECTLTVEDRGPGLNEEEISRLFSRFYRGADARRRHGSGLGLAIVDQVAQLHEGSVHAENREDGGARFTLRWPRR